MARVQHIPDRVESLDELARYTEISLDELYSLLRADQPLPSSPTQSPSSGDQYYDASTDTLYIYNSASDEWKSH